jgi:molybdenum cofactor sulfurtransferase
MLYLDYAGSSLSSYSNPHSDKNVQSLINETRELVLNFLNIPKDEYIVVFTSGSTDGIKFIGYNFPIREFSYTLSNHNSILGLRGLLECKTNVLDDDTFNILNTWGDIKEGINLVAFPAECNFSGKLFNQDKIEELKDENTFVLLDTSKYLTTYKLYSRPDFIPVSFYKIFGELTGLGALIIHKRTLPKLNKKYFGGGTYSLNLSLEHTFKTRDIPECLEDGTINFLSIIKLNNTIKQNPDYYSKNKSVELTKYSLTELKTLRHYNNIQLVEIYGINENKEHGSIIAFNLKDHKDDYIGFKDVEKLCDINNIKIRTGCFCNPGACNKYLNISSETSKSHFEKGNKCWDMKDIIDGKPTGAIRISFGLNSSYDDVKKFILFLKNNYVISEEHIPMINTSTKSRISEIYIYPIKGAQGFRVNNWEITENGLKWDREFIVYDKNDKSVTLKSNVRLGLIRPEINKKFLRLVNTETDDFLYVNMDRFETSKETINGWISTVLKEDCKLVRCEGKNFSNTSQYLFMNKNSLYDLNYRILLNNKLFYYLPQYLKDIFIKNYTYYGYGITLERFRPNIIIDGLNPYDEDNINSIKSNDIEFIKEEDCSRCYTTTVDYKRQQVDTTLEPMKTLLKYRKKDGKVLFGTLFNCKNSENKYLKEGEILF